MQNIVKNQVRALMLSTKMNTILLNLETLQYGQKYHTRLTELHRYAVLKIALLKISKNLLVSVKLLFLDYKITCVYLNKAISPKNQYVGSVKW